MHKEIIDKANKIIQQIEENKSAIKYLQDYNKHNGMVLYVGVEHPYMYDRKEPMHFEPWEIRLMIHNKKQRIQALEKELEQL